MLSDQRRSKWMNHRLLVFALLLVAGLWAMGQALLPGLANAAPANPINAAWEKVRAAGSYHFSSDVTQITVPVAKVTNVGRSSRTEQLRLEGQTDLREQTMQMQLWSDGGSLLQTEGGLALKVENGKTFVRQGATGTWQEKTGAVDALAPQGDFLAYLHAMRDVQAHEPEQRAGIAFTRYSFTIDGPAFAAYARDQMEAGLRAKGELPNGLRLSVSSYYEAMTGSGELWVGENGLPLRQILNLNFPEQAEQSTHAQIVVDFSRFGTPEQSALALWRSGDLGGLVGTLSQHLPDLAPLGLLFSMFAFAAFMLYYRRSRAVYMGLVSAIILSMVLGPVLSTLQLDGFFAAQAAKAAAQKEEQASNEAVQEAVDLGRPEFNPQVNPLGSAELGVRNSEYSALPIPNSALAAPALLTDNGVDTDADGLSDFAEERVGTDATFNDSDDDGVPDGQEVRGFTFAGKTWYMDAQNIDSNNDGMGDGQEWGFNPNGSLRSTPSDTDGDGIPDLFEDDNDNDGVPDRQDLAPLSLNSAIFGENNPLQLTLKNLTAGKPTFADFHIRPTDPTHLWYAFNVVDWPRNDNQGQVQDVDGGTFADLAVAEGRTPGLNESFGDMKLVPMLEMRLPATDPNLPPQSDLTPFNISVNALEGNQKVVYIPLSLVTDEQTGQRVAFTARMNYLPSGAWPNAHNIRLAWVVQMLTDLPCDHTNAQDVAKGCAADNYIHNAPQVVQSYYDDFRLTGFNVSEQHGAKTALIYEDPAVDIKLKDDVSLTALSLGLEGSFLAARDGDNNGQLDVDIDEVARRFNHPSNDTVTGNLRWGLDTPSTDILRVERHDYPTFDQAAIFTAMTDTVGILNSQFNTPWANDNTLKPTILYAYQQASRALGLDASQVSGNYVSMNGSGVTVDMLPAGQPRAALNTMVGMKWTHYCRTGSSWDGCAADLYWEELESRYGANPLAGEETDPDAAAGSNFVLQLYNVKLSQGVNAVVKVDNTLISAQSAQRTDPETASDVRGGLAAGGVAVKWMANQMVMARYVNQIPVKQQLGITFRRLLAGKAFGPVIGPIKRFITGPTGRINRVRGGAVAVGTTVAVTGLAVGLAYLVKGSAGGNQGAKITLKVLAISVQSIMVIVDPIMTTIAWSKALKAAGQSSTNILTSRSEAIGATSKANAIGAVIAVGVVWGFFIYSMVSNKVSAFSPEFNRALAETIAATLYIIILTVISLNPVGLIVVGIVSVIDLILTAACEGGDDNVRKKDGSCITIGAEVTKAIATVIYNYDIMIDTSRPDLVAPGAPDTQLTNPNQGFVAGNPFAVTMPITTHVVYKSPSGLLIQQSPWLFSRGNLRTTTFNYTLTKPLPQTVAASRDTMPGAWRMADSFIFPPADGAYAAAQATVSGFTLPAGLNQPAEFYLNMGYALPAYECWGIPMIPQLIPVCYLRDFTGGSSSKIDTLRYDILPNSVGGLMTLSPKAGGGAGMGWDASFGALQDADGDGLISDLFGGLDANDANPDSDGDSLTDTFEIERRAAGTPYSPSTCDGDLDGLTDAQEVRLGTNPAITDSDNDGLKDGQEVWHQRYDASCQPTNNWEGGWDVPINAATPFAVRVSADPSETDNDQDGLSDLAEKQLAESPVPANRVDKENRPYHPNFFNSSPITVLVDVNDSDKYVAVGQNLVYSTTVIASAALAPSLLDVNAPAEVGGPKLPALLGFNSTTFSGTQTVVDQTNFTVQSGTNGQQLDFSSNVRARLAPTAPPTWAWDPISGNAIGSYTAPILPAWAAATASSRNTQNSYRFPVLASENGLLPSTNTNSNVQMYSLPSATSVLLDDGTIVNERMGNTPPSIACNNAGTCMVAYSYQHNYLGTGLNDEVALWIYDAAGQRVGPGAILYRSSTVDGAEHAPLVASDGTNFFVVLETFTAVDNRTFLLARAFDAQGLALGQEFSLGGFPNRQKSLIWAGDRYRLAYAGGVPPNPQIDIREFNANGVQIGNEFTVVSDNRPSNSFNSFDLAYDPVRNRTALFYTTFTIMAALLQGTERVPTIIRATTAYGNFPKAVYDPRTGGFMISTEYVGTGSRIVTLWNADFSATSGSGGFPGLNPVTTVESYSEPGASALACPAVTSQAVVDLRFEELPGTTTFADSSGRGNNATCSNCPSPGLPGAVAVSGPTAGQAIGGGVDGPSSDYALAFHGNPDQRITFPSSIQNDFTIAFWYKATNPTNTSAFKLVDSAGKVDFGIGQNVYIVSASVPLVTSNLDVNDGAWHFIAATRDNATRVLSILIDGIVVKAGANTNPPNPGSTFELFGDHPAAIDHLRMWPSALPAATIQSIYDRTRQSYCLEVNRNRTTNQLNWFKLNATLQDTRGGTITARGAFSLTIDSDGPLSVINYSNDTFIAGNRTHTLGGNASDALSGVAAVEVAVNNGPFQPASGAASWAYNLTVTEGIYTIARRAIDNVGNVGPVNTIELRADATAPNVTLNAIPATPSLPTRNGNNQWITTLSGTVVDPIRSGVASGLPLAVVANAVEVRLQGQGDAIGNGWQPATLNAPGGSANWSISYALPVGLLDPTGSYTVSVRAVDRVGNQSADNAASAILKLDATGPAAALSSQDDTRTVISNTLTLSGVVTDTGTAGVDKVEVAFVTVEQIAALPNNISAAATDAQLNRTWLPATVAQPGAVVSSWSLPIPAGLEDEYQIDLRATDKLGNVLSSNQAWRGVIDTLNPRLTLTATDTGVTYFDDASQQQMHAITLSCSASDRYLDGVSFTCPASAFQPPVNSFANTAALQALFPDRTIRNGLSNSVTYWSPSVTPAVTIAACDLYGRCATANSGTVVQLNSQSVTSASAELVAAAAAGAPQAVIVAPSAGSFVAANGALNVSVAAEAGALLKTVTISLDNQVVQTLNFAQSENVTRTLRTVSLSGVSQGQHTLSARATDWANATQSSDFPVLFTLDTQAPVVTIDPATLTNADTWAVGSGILRFNGTASDAIGLASVQIREGDNPFSDAEFGNGTWQTALTIENPEGRTLTIVVRATDRAGRVSEVTQSIGTNLSTATAPDTFILSGPANPSNATNASFVLSGTLSTAGFECQLDGSAFAACTIPASYLDLSKGSHTFSVRALDTAGNVDLSPTSFTWTVNPSALDATITSSPANPSSSRDASFAFTGNGTAFDCALDEAAFTPCASPQNYSGLAYGDHSFQVRARNGSNVGAATRFIWTVVNVAPVANSQTVSTPENSAIALTLVATDADPLTYKVVNPAHGVLLGVPPALTYSPDSGFVGTDSFTFVANDGLNDSNVATVSINVVANNTDNTPPVITPQVVGTAGSNGWYVSDVNLTWNVVDAESAVTSQTGCDPITVNTETAGQSFTCSATSRGGTASQSVTIKLDKTAPETTITAQPANPSNTATAAFQFSGADGLSGPAGFECSLDSSAFAGCASPQNYSNLAEGSHTFQVRTVDGAGNRDATPASYTWTVQTLTVVATCGPITVYRNPQGQLVAPGWVGTIKLGTAGNNTIAGGTGPDLMLGLGGNDNLDGKAGDDLICGGDGVDLLTGAAGNDLLDGGTSNDVLNGGAGDFDSLNAGDGNDVLLDADGVISAQGGPGNDAFTIALRNGWRDRNGQPRFSGLAAGYGNDAVGLANLSPVRFFLDITGDERDNPASPLEGTDDGLVFVGLRDPASVIIKFERRVGAASIESEGEAETPISYEGFLVDPTTLSDESGAEFLTEAVGGDEPVEEVEQVEEARTFLFLPLVTNEQE